MSTRLRITTRVLRAAANRGVRLLLALTFAFAVFIVPATPPARCVDRDHRCRFDVEPDRRRPVAGRRRVAEGSRSTSRASDRRRAGCSTTRTRSTSRSPRSRSRTRSTRQRRQRHLLRRGLAGRAPSVRVHADRRRRHVVHVPPRHQRQARHERQPQRRRGRQDLHRRHQVLGRPRDQGRRTRRWRSRTLRSGRWFAPTGRGRPRSSPRTWRTRRRRCGPPSAPGSGSISTRAPPPRCTHRSTARSRSSTPTASRATSPSPYDNGAITYVEYGYAKQRGYPVANLQNNAGYFVQPVAAAVSARAQGCDLQPRRHAEPQRRVQQPGPSRLPDVELQLHDRADDARRRPSTPTRARRSASSSSTWCAPDSRRRSSSATRRSPRTSCRTRSRRSRRSPARQSRRP